MNLYFTTFSAYNMACFALFYCPDSAYYHYNLSVLKVMENKNESKPTLRPNLYLQVIINFKNMM